MVVRKALCWLCSCYFTVTLRTAENVHLSQQPVARCAPAPFKDRARCFFQQLVLALDYVHKTSILRSRAKEVSEAMLVF